MTSVDVSTVAEEASSLTMDLELGCLEILQTTGRLVEASSSEANFPAPDSLCDESTQTSFGIAINPNNCTVY
jgi:hypothetical protein